jgi:prepilin peptidase CpaA
MTLSFHHLDGRSLAIYVPLLALIAYAAVTDLRVRRIPNWLTLTAVVAGLAQSVTRFAVTSPNQSMLGLLAGFAITFVLYSVGGRGAGDVKLSAGIGAWLGPVPVVIVLAAAAVVSLVLALAQAAVWGKLIALLQSTGMMLVGLLNIRRLGAKEVITSGRAASSVDHPLPNAVSMLIATVMVVLWISAVGGG